MKPASLALIALIPLAAQEIKLPAGLDRLAAKASETVNVTMDSSMLQLASKFLSDNDPDQARVKKLVSGLKSIYVRSFEFDTPGAYPDSDVEQLRAQMGGPGWSRIVGVRSRREGENADVFLKTDNGKIAGLAIIDAEPKELTIVLINGTIDPQDVQELSGHFGIPNISVGGAGSKTPHKEAK
jgi:Domain of unknown function (DUF4252)